jgi:hypothetical protein
MGSRLIICDSGLSRPAIVPKIMSSRSYNSHQGALGLKQCGEGPIV